jgi:hypothetical protein
MARNVAVIASAAMVRPGFLTALAVAALAALLSGCSTTPAPAPVFDDVQPFSANRPGATLPRGWRPWIINRSKSPTQYDLVVDPKSQAVVLHAVADRAASGLKQRLDVDAAARPVVQWRWRVTGLIPLADNTARDVEDSPVRLMLFFDGDRRALPASELVKFELAKMVTGQEPPYATLMYIWENRQPVGTVIASGHTTRVQMVVAGSGDDRLGQWKGFERNYAEDFRRAFGEAPGRLIGVGILTDTDNTGERIEAFYGDIRLRAAR